MKKKTNPNKIPKTQADVDRARSEGWDEGVRFLMDLMVYTIGCDMNCDDEWLDFYHKRFMANLDSYLHGELTNYDMRKTAYAEKGWEVELV